METIRQYIESLFIDFPNTPEVRRAKEHLLEMAEDKYSSLKEDGISDNEAVAKVITEFGNLEELKEELGLTETFEKRDEHYSNATTITLADVKDIFNDNAKSALIRAIGVFCFITCAAPVIILQDVSGVVALFIMIGIGVALEIIQAVFTSRWDFIKNTRCAIDMATADYIIEEKRRSRVASTALKCVGILCIIFCFIPTIVIGEDYSAAILLCMIGFGVLLLILSGAKEDMFNMLLSINPNNTMGAEYTKGSGRVVYENKTTAALMSIYWPLVVCLYLCLSFMTFQWGITWIIFVIAGILHNFLEEALGTKE